MTWDTVQQIVRILMQLLAGYLVSKGLSTESMAQTLTGGLTSVLAFAWWFFWNRNVSTTTTTS